VFSFREGFNAARDAAGRKLGRRRVASSTSAADPLRPAVERALHQEASVRRSPVRPIDPPCAQRPHVDRPVRRHLRLSHPRYGTCVNNSTRRHLRAPCRIVPTCRCHCAQSSLNYDDLACHRLLNCYLKAKFHYASWFEAGSKLVADRFEAKFHYTIWFEAGLKLVGDQLRTSFEPAPNQLQTR